MKNLHSIVILSTVILLGACAPKRLQDSETLGSGHIAYEHTTYNNLLHYLDMKSFSFEIDESSQRREMNFQVSKDYPEDLPSEYTQKSGNKPELTDFVFFVHPNQVLKNDKFILEPTKGISELKREKEHVKYPIIDQKDYAIRLREKSSKKFTQKAAIKECSKQDGRLPTALDIVDFCSVLDCGKQDLWTISLNSADLSEVWVYDAKKKVLASKPRDGEYALRCVVFPYGKEN